MQEVSLVGVDCLGLDLRVRCGIEVQTLRVPFSRRVCTEKSPSLCVLSVFCFVCSVGCFLLRALQLLASIILSTGSAQNVFVENDMALLLLSCVRIRSEVVYLCN